jgi:hypothetical protein
MQGIYTYIPETNHVPKEPQCCSYSVATVYGAHITSCCVVSNVVLIIIIIIIKTCVDFSEYFIPSCNVMYS